MFRLDLLDLAIIIGAFIIGATVIAPIISFVWSR